MYACVSEHIGYVVCICASVLMCVCTWGGVVCVDIWDSAQQNHPYDALSQDKQKKSNTRIEMYG